MDAQQHVKMRIYRYIGATTALNAELWAMGALATLQQEIAVSNYFNRDFSSDFASKGEIVNAHRLGKFTGHRLEEGGTLETEDPDATEVIVKLDQHITAAFPVKDRDNQRSFRDLMVTFIQPAARAMIEQIDLIAQGEKYNFWKNQTAVSAGMTYASAVALNKKMTQNLAPRAGRVLIGGAGFEADTLLIDEFIKADNSGDGSPLINGQLARGAGLSLIMSQMFNENAQDGTFTTETADVNGALLAGATTITVDGDSLANGSPPGAFFKTAAGNVHRVVSETVGSNAGDYVIEPALFAAVADNEELTFYTPDTVDGTLASGYSDWITYDATGGFATREPEVGDGVAFGTADETYGILEIDHASDKIKLNRPLDAAVADAATINIFPAGNYNFAMLPGACTIVVRPMELPSVGTGVASAVAADNGWALRAMESYTHTQFKRIFSYDCLAGVKTTDVNQGALLITQS